MNNSSKHLGWYAVYVRGRKYAHNFLNYFLHQFLETLYNFPPMLISHRINTRLFQLTRHDSRTRDVPDEIPDTHIVHFHTFEKGIVLLTDV